MERTILHVDVNSAFLSWSAVDMLNKGEKIDIREIPSVIGGDPQTRHGIVLAKSIPAKSFGIVTAESLFSALRKCPELMIVPPNMEVYSTCSHKMMEMLKDYTPVIEKYSIDECFLDITDMYESPLEVAENIRERIKRELGFTVSVGVSTNKLLAKMASELRKPDKVNTLYKDEIQEKMWHLPVNELFMVGKSATDKLNKMYIFTIGDIAKSDINLLKSKFKSYGALIWEYANGIDKSEVQGNTSDLKVISNSTTFSPDIKDRNEAIKVIISLAENVAVRLRKSERFCYSISVSIRNNNFKNYSHQRKLENPTNLTQVILDTAKELFDEVWKKEPIRLIGVQLSQLTEDEFEQLSLFDQKSKPINKALDKAIDSIRDKFGKDAVVRSILLDEKKHKK